MPIRSIGAGAVLRVWLVSPYMLRPASVRAGVVQLSVTWPRSARGWYRAEFYGIVVTNEISATELSMRIPNLSTVGDPARPFRCDELSLPYRFVRAAQMFDVPAGVAPETVVLALNHDRLPGSAAKFQQAGRFTSHPVAI